MRLKKSLTLVAALLVATLPALKADPLESIRKAPEFSFSTSGKGPEQLSSFSGKVVALEFIFTTCPHCQAASRFMTKLQAEYGARGLQVIDVAVNPNADLLVDNFVKDYGVGFPVGWTSQEKMEAFMGFSGGRFVVPQLVLIDRKGMIHYQTPALSSNTDWEKQMAESTVRQHIEQLLASR